MITHRHYPLSSNGTDNTPTRMSSYNHTQKSHQIPVTANMIVQGALPGATPTDGLSEGPQMGEHSIYQQEEFNGPRDLCQATTNKLPDDVLLVIFDFYLDNENLHGRGNVGGWHTLVHVCRRWRNVVFASPRRLDLRLLCRKTTPVRAMLDIWPALPINIEGVWGQRWESGLPNIIAALQHSGRVRSINLIYFPGPFGEILIETMRQARFPELTELRFLCCDHMGLVLPNSFIGGSAPRLRTLWLTNVSFPAAPNPLLSARDLVDLKLDTIPPSGYIPPTSMVACLSFLNKLESLFLGFRLPPSHPDQPNPPRQSRVVLPALIRLVFFNGMSEYLEYLVAHFDTPVLNQLDMTFYPKPVFDVPHLKEFIGRAKGLKQSKAAELRIFSLNDQSSIQIDLQQPHSSSIGVRCDAYYWQVFPLALLCNQVSHLFSFVERLDLLLPESPPGNSIVVSIQFLEFFRPFTATRSLYVPESLGPLIASVLQEPVGESATEVLPSLRNIFLEGSAKSGLIQVIQPFVDARRLSGRPVAVNYLEERQKVGR